MMDIDEEDLKDAVDENLESCLEGLTIVISGVFEYISREKLEEFIRDHKGRNTSAISGKTDYLVVGIKLEDGRAINEGSKYCGA